MIRVNKSTKDAIQACCLITLPLAIIFGSIAVALYFRSSVPVVDGAPTDATVYYLGDKISEEDSHYYYFHGFEVGDGGIHLLIGHFYFGVGTGMGDMKLPIHSRLTDNHPFKLGDATFEIADSDESFSWIALRRIQT